MKIERKAVLPREHFGYDFCECPTRKNSAVGTNRAGELLEKGHWLEALILVACSSLALVVGSCPAHF